MREILMVPFLISFCCHPYVLCLYIWLFRLENHFLITNDYLYFNDTGAQDNSFSIVFFYFFSVTHFYQLPEQLLRLGRTYSTKTIDYPIFQLATFRIRYFELYNVLKEFGCLQFINPLLYDHVKNYFVDKSYIRLYKSLNNVINLLKCQSSDDIENFLQSMTFNTNVA
ncbi:hypothetical protein THOM_0933 [Trachipleistophora hominis]|uniref:Uncharacterized protein n=1 Tax=Trachipleistophora hominis TaxID=72359 RepID=L7JXA1_TRAHO|nr:hypothetical protein THOM_0933 [Trachipleistophora hominis]